MTLGPRSFLLVFSMLFFPFKPGYPLLSLW